MTPRPPRSTLFPYTTLFRSLEHLITQTQRAVAAELLASSNPRHVNILYARHQLELADRKSTRLNSSHTVISYAVFCLKKKIETKQAVKLYIRTNESI